MKKTKIKIICLLLLSLIFFIVGCATLIKTETVDVEAVVVDSWYQIGYSVPVRVGNTTTYVRHPAKYIVVVEYEDLDLTINNEELYQQYKNRIGDTITCTMVIQYYDDGSI